MAYAPQRRHAVASLSTTIQAFSLIQHLYAPSIIIFVSRGLAQLQITAPAFIHPHRSLLALFVMLTLMNLVAVMFHLLDFASGMNTGKGILLDFVGQAQSASLTRVLVIDLLLYILQSVSLVISYLTMQAGNIPSLAQFAGIDDLLLPPSAGEELVFDVESGEAMSKDMPSVWVDDGDEEDATARTQLLPSYSSSAGRRGPPLVFDLPLSHILALIVRLPAPSPAPRVLAAATPVASLPATSTDPAALAAAVASARLQHAAVRQAEAVEAHDSTQTGGAGAAAGSRRAGGGDDDAGRRIPGDYWTRSR
ncbi:hypothetical protein Q5752_004161 [Cryptotrichosporon argae]